MRKMITNVPSFPPPDAEIRREYRQLISDIDQRVQQLETGRLADICRCRPGCSECCIAFSILPLEAALLLEALNTREIILNKREGQCIFLRDSLCSFYQWRPVICRTQGMALAYIDQDSQTIEVSACEHNFPPDAAIEHDDLLFMDQFNERLADLNLRYCRQHDLPVGQRIALADLPARLR